MDWPKERIETLTNFFQFSPALPPQVSLARIESDLTVTAIPPRE